MAGPSILTFEGALPPALVALLAAILVGAGGWAALRARVPIRIRVALALLRAVAVGALAIALLGPAVLSKDEIVLNPPLYVLVDASQSMGISDLSGAPARRELAVARLGSRDVERFDYGKELMEVREWKRAANERSTATGDAIFEAVRRMRGRPGGALVVVSDGRTNAGLDPVRVALQARDRGIRVHTIGVGTPGATTLRDRKIVNLLCPAVAQVDAAVPIHGYLVALGEKGRTISVILKVDDEVVQTKEVVADGESFSARIPFLYTPTREGEHRVQIEAATADGEFDSKNNTLSTVLRATQKGLRILYLEGKFRWEFTFLKRALLRMPDAHVVAMCLGDGSESLSEAELDKYNVVVIGDLKVLHLGVSYLEALEKHVSHRGAGLLLVAGRENLSAGAGWSQTPMASLLPFDLEGVAPPEEVRAGVRLTSFGADHFAVALDRDSGTSLRAWRDLPKLDAVARAGAVKPGASVLAETDDGRPLLIAQPYGKGRVLAFLGETAWRWALDSESSAETYRRFWHQTALWLARQETNARKLWLELPRALYASGDPVEMTAVVEDPPGNPVPDATLSIVLNGPSGESAVSPSFYGGAYHATVLPPEPGDYRIVASAKRGTEELPPASVRFQVLAPASELDQPGADLESLTAVAAAGGGMYKPLADSDAVFERIAKETQPTRVERLQRKSLWDRAWLVIVFVAALALEWGIRKWHRLL